ncbi:hypothetical protein D3C75_1007460 [compost metagenome]
MPRNTIPPGSSSLRLKALGHKSLHCRSTPWCVSLRMAKVNRLCCYSQVPIRRPGFWMAIGWGAWRKKVAPDTITPLLVLDLVWFWM